MDGESLEGDAAVMPRSVRPRGAGQLWIHSARIGIDAQRSREGRAHRDSTRSDEKDEVRSRRRTRADSNVRTGSILRTSNDSVESRRQQK